MSLIHWALQGSPNNCPPTMCSLVEVLHLMYPLKLPETAVLLSNLPCVVMAISPLGSSKEKEKVPSGSTKIKYETAWHGLPPG